MQRKKKVIITDSSVGKRFTNWFAQLCLLISPRFLYLVAGRGSSKTTDILVNRLMDMVVEMPGAPLVWVSDTYANLQKNVLPTVLEALENKGYKEGVHYVLGKKPPEFSKSATENLPENIRKTFWKPINKLASYKHTMIFYSGLNIRFGSLDRPASLAGASYVHIIGDEVKYFKPEKIGNLEKAVRGYRILFGHSVYYRGHTFTTDMPNADNTGEYDWILSRGKNMNIEGIMLAIKTGFIKNDALHEFMLAKKEGSTEEQLKKERVYLNWKERWIKVRKHFTAHTFYSVVSSYVNVDILGPDYFQDAINNDIGDLHTAMLSMKPQITTGERFYANLSEKDYYDDGVDEKKADMLFGITETEDCRVLRYLDTTKPIDAGMDFGKMMSLVIGQNDQQKNIYRLLKNFYTLSPDWLRQIADLFINYMAPHVNKSLYLYYDRAANNYAREGQDLASEFKKCIEYAADGKPTGWRVTLMSINQGNIGQNQEYSFMQKIFSRVNKKMPIILIDRYQCKEAKSSMESARTKINRKGVLVKDKSTEKLPVNQLPMKSTNMSDAVKYLLMRRAWISIMDTYDSYIGNTSVK